MLVWLIYGEQKEADRMTLPMGVDMIQYMSDVMFPNYRIGPLLEHAVCVAAKVDYSLVARQSEYLYTPHAKVHHHLRARDGMQWTVNKNGKDILINWCRPSRSLYLG